MNHWLWLVVISVLPVLLPAYLGVIYGLCRRVDGLDPREVISRYFGVLYLPFAFGVAGLYITQTGVPALDFRPAFVVAIPVGAGGYYLTTLVWRHYTGKPIRRGHRDLPVNLLGILAVVPEELLFRAGLVPIVDWVDQIGYLAYSSVLFGLYHFNGGRHEVVSKTLLGVLLGGSYLAFGTIVVPVLIHLGYNLAWLLFVTGRFP